MGFGSTVGAGVCGTVTFAALGAGMGAANGAVGAAVLDAAGHSGYDALEGAQNGALGSAIINGTLGCCMGMLLSCGWGLFNNIIDNDSENQSDNRSSGFIPALIMSVGFNTLSGMLGYAILNADSGDRQMELAQTAAALATGSAITFCPQYFLTFCIVLPCVVLAVVAAGVEMDDAAESDVASTVNNGHAHRLFSSINHLFNRQANEENNEELGENHVVGV